MFNGYNWIKEKLKIERKIINSKPSLPFTFKSKELLKVIPKDAFWGGYYRLGTLGGGNHFLELHTIEDIISDEECRKLGCYKGQVIFIMHTGSNVFSKRVDNYYSIRFQKENLNRKLNKNFRKFLYHLNDFNLLRLFFRLNLFFRNVFKGIPVDTPEGKRFLIVFYSALNYSFVNREVISWFIKKTLEKTVKKEFMFELISDTIHESIDYENFNDGYFWVHRNGATKVECLNNSDKQLLLIPSCRSGPSFLCIPHKKLDESRYSVNHGVGRLLTKKEAKERFYN
ncbi:MAG: RtcB family protein, partial [Candidatus Omnitrophica bacterium]|nr:RtcB family protein [Candidatus Omnitrophota bacterium]